MTTPFPEAALGTMTFGGQVDRRLAARMVAAFTDAGHRWIDTAHVYNDGETERILGRLLADHPKHSFRLASKVHPGDGGGLGASRLAGQLEASLERLGVESLALLYLHQPDPRTPEEETLEACDRLHRQGKFLALGLSNYPVEAVARIRARCEASGWVLPTVYQGMYNTLTRAVAEELLPALRGVSMGFHAYNPLAGGLLTGKYGSPERLPKEGRFALLDFYRDRYWKAPYFEALAVFREACRQAGVSPAEAALRWLAHHAGLGETPGCAVIVGASRMAHLTANLSSLAGPPLPDTVVSALDRAWELARPACPAYYR